MHFLKPSEELEKYSSISSKEVEVSDTALNEDYDPQNIQALNEILYSNSFNDFNK